MASRERAPVASRSPRELIERTIAAIAPADAGAERAARAALDAKAKPRGSLGRLEDLACRIAAIRGSADPGELDAAIVVCAADHGIAREGVSAYPQEVTAQMVQAFAAGEAAVCVLARRAGASLVIADLGCREPVGAPGVLDRRVRAGTANSALGPAMERGEAERAIAIGIELAADLASRRIGIVGLGEMGIGNSTAAALLTAALTRLPPRVVCGRGTGLDDEGLARKVAVAHRALEANRVHPRDPIGAIAGVGGLEIAALSGLVLGCAAHRIPVLVDGFITAAAALAAVCLAGAARDHLLAAHLSPEPGHRLICDALGLDPLIALEMRLGEGSGAALALPIVSAALAIQREMATFAAAGVSDSGA